MKVGVDTSVIVAAVHANHPLHVRSADWLNSAFDEHEVIVAHHSLLEAYAVLTRMPGEFRLSPVEAETVLRETFLDNARIAPFDGVSMWEVIARIGSIPAAGGGSYDAFISGILVDAGAESIVTRNVEHFRRVTTGIPVIDPLT